MNSYIRMKILIYMPKSPHVNHNVYVISRKNTVQASSFVPFCRHSQCLSPLTYILTDALNHSIIHSLNLYSVLCARIFGRIQRISSQQDEVLPSFISGSRGKTDRQARNFQKASEVLFQRRASRRTKQSGSPEQNQHTWASEMHDGEMSCKLRLEGKNISWMMAKT